MAPRPSRGTFPASGQFPTIPPPHEDNVRQSAFFMSHMSDLAFTQVIRECLFFKPVSRAICERTIRVLREMDLYHLRLARPLIESFSNRLNRECARYHEEREAAIARVRHRQRELANATHAGEYRIMEYELEQANAKYQAFVEKFAPRLAQREVAAGMLRFMDRAEANARAAAAATDAAQAGPSTSATSSSVEVSPSASRRRHRRRSSSASSLSQVDTVDWEAEAARLAEQESAHGIVNVFKAKLDAQIAEDVSDSSAEASGAAWSSIGRPVSPEFEPDSDEEQARINVRIIRHIERRSPHTLPPIQRIARAHVIRAVLDSLELLDEE